MSTKDTGGQAFPCYERGSAGAGPLELTDPGMTLRDYFAAKALPAIKPPNPATRAYLQVDEFHAYASVAYQMADAMLKARKA